MTILLGVVVHTCNPSALEAEAGDLQECTPSLGHTEIPRETRLKQNKTEKDKGNFIVIRWLLQLKFHSDLMQLCSRFFRATLTQMKSTTIFHLFFSRLVPSTTKASVPLTAQSHGSTLMSFLLGLMFSFISRYLLSY